MGTSILGAVKLFLVLQGTQSGIIGAMTGQHDVDTDKMAEFERERLSGGVASPGIRRE